MSLVIFFYINHYLKYNEIFLCIIVVFCRDVIFLMTAHHSQILLAAKNQRIWINVKSKSAFSFVFRCFFYTKFQRMISVLGLHYNYDLLDASKT